MRKRYSDKDAFFAALRALIEGWCDRRCLLPLGIILPAYNSFNGLTDGWGELLKALKTLTLIRDALLPDEHETVADLRQAAEDVLGAR